jgi:hypothetical protein
MEFEWDLQIINNKEFEIQMYFEDAIEVSAYDID